MEILLLTSQDISGHTVFWKGSVCWARKRLGLAVRSLLGPERSNADKSVDGPDKHVRNQKKTEEVIAY